MSTTEIQTWLRESIAAVKAGEAEKARALLMRVLEADERNEQAWLWLSGVSDSDEDRRICLENVLTINPDNKAAQAGLAKLNRKVGQTPETQEDAVPAPTPTSKRYQVRREKTAVSLARGRCRPSPPHP